MEATSWEKIAVERLSDKIQRQCLHGDRATVARFFLARGAVIPRHSHDSEQCTSVLAGALKLVFDDGEVVLRPGEVLLIPSHKPHAAEALEDTTVLDIFAPRRDDWIRRDDAYLRT
jgi:quercetin dioxygenase-like cupin family protein